MTETTLQTPTHGDLLKDFLTSPFSEEETLEWMVIHHTHHIRLRPIRGAQPVALAALTQRGAAAVIAALWPDRDDQRSEYTFWHKNFITRTPYEVLGAIPQELIPALQEKLDRLRNVPWVDSVEEAH